MPNKKNVQASNQNLINSQDGIKNSLSGNAKKSSPTNTQENTFPTKLNSSTQSGIKDTKGKR